MFLFSSGSKKFYEKWQHCQTSNTTTSCDTTPVGWRIQDTNGTAKMSVAVPHSKPHAVYKYLYLSVHSGRFRSRLGLKLKFKSFLSYIVLVNNILLRFTSILVNECFLFYFVSHLLRCHVFFFLCQITFLVIRLY